MSFTGPRFLLVDDHALFRMGLGLMLTERWPQAMLTQAGTWAQALDHLRAQAVDLVMLDIHLPDGHGVADLAVLRGLAPQARVLLMSAEADAAQVAQARAAGAEGFVPKCAQAADIVAAVQAVLRGESAYGALPYAALPQTAQPVAQAVAQPMPLPVPHVAQEGGVVFSALQLAILRHLGKGTPNKAIARQMAMSESAVRAEVSWITEWLQATSRTEAYERAVARGLLAP
ncbi:MAG: response regulator transcription factor [Proteobacteria bacterium]|uniref:response regulator n=1 Tax=Aquabacterium sp. TaxID=1872578 RepID=UPI0035C76C6E|nr:response regulator transcription factor [Pseudomonadota bacterium]